MHERILVIGGAGYIGSHAVRRLIKTGYQNVFVLDNFSTGHKILAERALGDTNTHQNLPTIITGDYCNSTFIRNLLTQYKFDVIMHFAAKALVSESVENPLLYHRKNVVGTLTLLEAALENNVRGFVFSSTCATFGLPISETLDEQHPQNPINPYGSTKLAIELLLRDLSHRYEMRHAILRYFNAAGADDAGDIGEMHTPETHLIPNLLKCAHDGQPLNVFGDDYPTPDGTCIRDYIHVNDLADAHILAMRSILDNKTNLALNLGSERGSSVKEIIRSAEAVLGRPVPHTVAPRRPGDPPRLVGNSSKAQSLLNWKTNYTLDRIIETANTFYLNQERNLH